MTYQGDFQDENKSTTNEHKPVSLIVKMTPIILKTTRQGDICEIVFHAN